MTTAAAIQRTLHLIIPTASTIPESLTDLATSLLAQSRAKAPSLKPDEEIARTFACSHIASERLKNRLGLEIGKVGPPCGPRIYKRLYAFLDSALPAAPSTPRTNRVKNVAATPTSGRSAKPVANERASAAKATPTSLGKRNRATTAKDEGLANLPRFTMPLIKHLCAAMDTPRLATHVYAGTESVHRLLQSGSEDSSAPGTPSKRRRGNSGEPDTAEPISVPVPTVGQVPALVAVIYAVAASTTQNCNSSEDDWLAKIQTAVESYFQKLKTPPAKVEAETLSQDMQTYLEAAEPGWRELEWCNNLQIANFNNGETAIGMDGDDVPTTPRRRPAKTPLRRKEKHESRKIDEDEFGAAGLLPGLGTMFQPAVDWLSDDRRTEFAAWKEDILGSIAMVEQEG